MLVPLASADIGVGDSRAQVLQQLGHPLGHAQLGDREILQYPNGAEIELRDGRVTEVVGPLPPSQPAVTYTPPANAAVGAAAAQPATVVPPARTTPSATTVAAAPVKSTPPAATARARAASAATAGAAPATPTGSNQSLVKLTEQMEAQSGPAGTMQALNQQMAQITQRLGPGASLALPMPGAQPKHLFGPKFAAALLLHFAATLFALRLAFRLEEMDALWSGVFAISAIDLAIYGMLEALGPATAGLSSMVAIESGVCALVMVVTVQKFCFNKKLQYAVVTAMSVKTVVQLCDLFLFPLALHALFH